MLDSFYSRSFLRCRIRLIPICVLLYFLSEFYRYLRLRFLLCRRSLLGSHNLPRSSLKEYPSCLFLRASSRESVNTYRETPRPGCKVLGDLRVAASRSDPFRKNMAEYHKKKIKEIKYVWSRHTFDRH